MSVILLVVLNSLVMPVVAVACYLRVYLRVGLRGVWLFICLLPLLFLYARIWSFFGMDPLSIAMVAEIDYVTKLFGPLIWLTPLFPLVLVKWPKLSEFKDAGTLKSGAV